MFDFVRNHTRLALGFMLLLIIPSFIFFGIDGYTRFTGGGNTTVAKVDGVSITRAEWENVHQRAIDRARRQNPEQDNKSLDSPEARYETLEGLMRDRVMSAAATKMHLAPSDDRLRRLFATDPQFQAIRNPDGTVNRELLAMQGPTGALTRLGVEHCLELIERKRRLVRRVSAIAGTDYADLLEQFVGLLFEKVQTGK